MKKDIYLSLSPLPPWCLSLSPLSPPIYLSTSIAESGWSNVDYQREINRGQIRSRRRALARFALFTTRRRDADASRYGVCTVPLSEKPNPKSVN